MKPTNYDSQGCDPMSSNCVIWQGPDIECINLCKGDSISTVVNNLALELCALLDSVNTTTFDLSCLNLQECAPDDFKGLIQLLIDRICALEGIEPGTGSGSTGCPDCVVEICEFFYYPGSGGTQTTMRLEDYVRAVGEQICIQVNQINTINTTIADHESRITDNTDRIETLEGAGITLPQITPVCVLNGQYDLDAVLIALEEQFCSLRDATGDDPTILTALAAALQIVANNDDRLSAPGSLSTIDGWFPDPDNLAESFTNMWHTIKDARDAIAYIQQNCCDTTCGAINLNMNAILLSPTQLRIDYVGSIPNAFVDDSTNSTFGEQYSRLTIENVGGGSGTQIETDIQVKQVYFDGAQAQIINLNGALVDGTQDVNVNLLLRLRDNTLGTQCESIIQTVALGTNACPDIILVPSYFEINYSFSWAGSATDFVIELYETAALPPSPPIASFQHLSNSTGANGTFVGLNEYTSYSIRLLIDTVPCDFEVISTLEYPNIPPSLIAAPIIDPSSPTGLQDHVSIEAWTTEYESYFGDITP
jgi:hypothetical protein